MIEWYAAGTGIGLAFKCGEKCGGVRRADVERITGGEGLGIVAA